MLLSEKKLGFVDFDHFYNLNTHKVCYNETRIMRTLTLDGASNLSYTLHC